MHECAARVHTRTKHCFFRTLEPTTGPDEHICTLSVACTLECAPMAPLFIQQVFGLGKFSLEHSQEEVELMQVF